MHLISALLSQHCLVLAIALEAGYDAAHAELDPNYFCWYLLVLAIFRSNFEDTFQCQATFLTEVSISSLFDQRGFDGRLVAYVTSDKE